MVVRSFRKSDLDACFALDQVCFPVGIAYSRAELRYFLGKPNAFAMIAEANGSEGLSGFLIANDDRSSIAPHGSAHIITLDVAPDLRRTGVAAILMAEAERHYRERGFRRLALEVAVDNEAALCFYRKHGFVAGERLPGYYNGRLDAWTMSKLLHDLE